MNGHSLTLTVCSIDRIPAILAAVLEGKGLNLLIDKDRYQHKNVLLLEFKSLGGGVVQKHYALK
ncbi:hypothetical protein [Paenibacillus aestuarii]|uniref:ACT domain-containing protein n=1 Tax=Paenibacillus aestuarii TaxID=516965 RepID=A0ABW0KIC5_9BACL|nr:hypothetical protein [Paenibacillus aestuarii]